MRLQVDDLTHVQLGADWQDQSAFEHLPVPALLLAEGRIAALNAVARTRFLRLLQAGSLNPAGMPAGVLLPGLDPDSMEPGERRGALLANERGSPVRVTVACGQACHAGRPARILVVQEAHHDAQAAAQTLLEDVLDAATVAKVITHAGRILYVNRAFCELFGYTRVECLGAELDELVLPEGTLYESEMLLHQLAVQGKGTVETARRTRAGTLIDVTVIVAEVRLGHSTGMVVTYRDIGQQKREQTRLRHSAQHDPLTGLSNRADFLDEVARLRERLRRRPDRRFAMLFLDLDGFKPVNDVHGHAAGDALLIEVAHRLERTVRPQDRVARFGGDEFALLVDECGDEGDAERIAARVQAEVRLPVMLPSGVAVQVAASLGVVIAASPTARVDEILSAADAAMYRAKAAGRGRHEIVRQG